MQSDWDLKLNTVVFAYNTSVHAVTKMTPFELKFGRTPKIPLDLVYGVTSEPSELLQKYEVEWDYTEYSEKLKGDLAIAYQQVAANRDLQIQKSMLNHERNIRGCDFKPGDRVWLFNPTAKKLKSKWRGPYVVVDTLKLNKTKTKNGYQ